MARNIYPIPEAIDGRRWTVADGRPRVDTAKRVLFAPVGDTDADRHSRAHEMAHARITPKGAPDRMARAAGVSEVAVQVCEDRRVHEFLRRRRIPVPGCLTSEEAMALAAKLFDKPRELAALYVAAAGTGDGERLAAGITREAMARGVDGKLQHFFECADAVCKAAVRGPDGRGRHPAETVRGFKVRTIPAAKLFDQLFPEREEADAAAASMKSVALSGAQFAGRKTVKWGALKPIERAPMPVARRPDRRGIKRRFTEEGTVPVAVHRLTTDGRLFTRRRKREKGGTVLVDYSGSMSLSAESLREIIEAAPAAKVAVYSGSGRTGRLVVVADRGRCASAEGLRRARYGGGNVVDGPALRWLAGQAEPRLWVSDGIVTGCGDDTCGELFADAVAICRGAGIVRVGDAAGAVEAMK